MTSSDIVPSILITHQILNIIQGGVVQHVPHQQRSEPKPWWVPRRTAPRRAAQARWLALRRRYVVDDSDYKRICLSLLHALWNSSIISDSIHLISPSSLHSWMNPPYCV